MQKHAICSNLLVLIFPGQCSFLGNARVRNEHCIIILQKNHFKGIYKCYKCYFVANLEML